jgi:hypothetical protein
VITATQAREFMDQALGVSVPSFLVSAAIEQVEAVEPAMFEAGYSEATQTLIQSMAVALIAGADFARSIKSQAAPSGASRSFDKAQAAITAMRRRLAALDTAGTVTDLVGPDPTTNTMLLVVC